VTLLGYGDPRLPDRFWDKVHVVADASALPGPCWIWGAVTRRGYGRFRVGNRMRSAYQLTADLAFGPAGPGVEPDHLCRVRACVNPAHLERVTHYENIMRGRTVPAINASRTHCPQGHPYAGANLLMDVTRDGGPARRCKTCRREQLARAKAKYLGKASA